MPGIVFIPPGMKPDESVIAMGKEVIIFPSSCSQGRHLNSSFHFSTGPADGIFNKKLFHHPDSAVTRMGDNLAGNTAEDKLLSSRETLPSNYDSTIFSLISF
jgi:hypothetical protein